MKVLRILILIAILTLIFGCKRNPPPQEQTEVKYNGFTFVKNEGMWRTELRHNTTIYVVDFRFNPYEAENVSVSGRLKGFTFQNTHITFDPTAEELQYVALAATELTLSLANVFGVAVNAACTKEYPGVCPPRPIVDCGSQNASVFLLRQEQPTAILLEGRCIILQGKGMELVRAVDKFLYQFYGIM